MNKKLFTLFLITMMIAIFTSACGAQLQSPIVFPTATRAAAPAAAPMTTDATPEPTAETTTTLVLACGDGRQETIPEGGQIYWSNHRSGNTDVYAVIYDPKQGGSSDHPAYGWWYQPCLPAGPDRIAHEVAMVLNEGSHRFTGPECRVWWNNDGNSPWEQGNLIISRQNVLAMMIEATAGAGTEAWVGIKCVASWASGFSFERLEPMPAP